MSTSDVDSLAALFKRARARHYATRLLSLLGRRYVLLLELSNGQLFNLDLLPKINFVCPRTAEFPQLQVEVGPWATEPEQRNYGNDIIREDPR